VNANFYALRRKLPEFAEITQNNVITPFKVTNFGTNRKFIYDFLLVVNTNLPPILHCFQEPSMGPRYSRQQVRNRYTWLPLLRLTSPVEGFPQDDLREIFSGCQWMSKVPNAVEILPAI